MGAERRSKMKGGRATTNPAAVALGGGQKLSTQYEGAAEANPTKYLLIYIRGEVGVDKKRGGGGIFGGGGSGNVIV